MARINLLPWREKARQRQQRFMTAAALGAVILTFAGALASYFLIEDWIQAQEARNAFLTAEIATLDRKIKEIKEIEKKSRISWHAWRSSRTCSKCAPRSCISSTRS